MNLFTEIQGLHGEELASALLRVLLLRSQEIRDGFVRLVSTECPSGPIAASSHFACYTEVPTEDDELGQGRVDVVVEADDAVIAIENKLDAGFQEGQPEKYLKSLRAWANRPAGTRPGHAVVRPLLVLLYPERRDSDMRKVKERVTLSQLDADVGLLTWESVLDAMDGVRDRLDPATAVILQEFRAYVRQALAFLRDWDAGFPHTRRWRGAPSDAQRMVLWRIWSLFPQPGQKMGVTATTAGYYFYPDKRICWFGFVAGSEIADGDADGAELIVVLGTGEIPPGSPDLQPIQLARPVWGFGDEPKAWKVAFDRDWSEPTRWEEALRPFRDLAKE
ncbi:PD-(D/E)XK nuclease family protein [Candidatus Latescibacterota bacterium]